MLEGKAEDLLVFSPGRSSNVELEWAFTARVRVLGTSWGQYYIVLKLSSCLT